MPPMMEECGPDRPHVSLKRRKQVKSACSNCRKSKTACCDQRPCRRCISLGLAESCVDVPRKRREKKKNIEPLEGTDCFKFVVVNPGDQSNKKALYSRPSNYVQTHPESSLSSFAPSPPYDEEKHRMQQQIDQLLKEKEEQSIMIESLRCSLNTHQMFSGLSLSRWRLLVDGICELQSFSDGFRRLISHSTDNLHSTYTCVKMYPRQEFPKTQKLYGLIASGRVESLTARVPLVRGTGELIEVFSIMKIEFQDGKPAFLTMCMKEYDPHDAIHGNLPFFEATHVRLRTLPQFGFHTIDMNSHSTSSIQEVSPDHTPSPPMMDQSGPYPPHMERSPYPVANHSGGGHNYYPHQSQQQQQQQQAYYPPRHSPPPIYGQGVHGSHMMGVSHQEHAPYGSRGLLDSLPPRTADLHNWSHEYE